MHTHLKVEIFLKLTIKLTSRLLQICLCHMTYAMPPPARLQRVTLAASARSVLKVSLRNNGNIYLLAD